MRGDDDLLTAGHREAHDRDNGLRVRGVVAPAQLDIGVVLLGQRDEGCGWAGVQARWVRHDQGLRDGVHSGPRLLIALLTCFELRHGGLVDSGVHQTRDRGNPGDQLGIGNDHLREERLGIAPHVVEVKVDE